MIEPALRVEQGHIGEINAVRAREISAVLERFEDRQTVAVLTARLNGEVRTYIAAGAGSNLTRAQQGMLSLAQGEIAVRGRRDVDAEIKVLEQARHDGALPLALAASRPFCRPSCLVAIPTYYHGTLIADRVAIWPQNVVPEH